MSLGEVCLHRSPRKQIKTFYVFNYKFFKKSPRRTPTIFLIKNFYLQKKIICDESNKEDYKDEQDDDNEGNLIPPPSKGILSHISIRECGRRNK